MLHTVARCALLAILSVLLCLGCAGEEDGLNRQDGGGETASDAPGEAGGGRTLASDGIAGNGGDASRGGRSAGGPSGAAGRGDAGTGDPPSGGSDGGGGALGTGTEGGAGVGAAGSPTMGGTASGGAATGGSGGSASGGTPGGSAGQGGGGELPEGAVLELDHTRMSLDSISLGATAVETFTLTNRGASTSGVPSISTDVPSDAPNPVTIAGCDNALPGGASCELTISITPLELGLFDAVIRIRAEPGIEAPHLSIYAVGTVIGFEISGPTALDLGDIPSGVPVEHTVTVTALIDLSDLEVFTNGEVSIDDAQSTCTQTLAAGDTCVVTVQFDSPEVGWKGGRVGIRAGGSLGQLAVVDMTANVTNAADLAVDPEAPEPFVAYVDETTAPMVFTVTNLGASTSGTITAVLVGEGLGPASFDIVDTDCTTLAPQASCTLSVVCSPQPSAASLTREAILSVTDGNSHVPVRLSAKVSYR